MKQHVFALKYPSTVHSTLRIHPHKSKLYWIMTKIFDIQQSINAANGNTSLAKELFTMLINDLDVRLQQIKSSFQEKDMEMLGEHIHKLYGATAYCIVPNLRARTKILDDALREKQFDNINELVETVLNEMKRLIDEAPNFLEKDWLEYQTES